MFPGGMDLQQLLQQAQQMQEQLASAQEQLAAERVQGSAGGGLVKATVTGSGELVSLDIDQSVVDPDDVETLADLVVAAVRDGSDKAKQMMAERLGPFAQGLGGLGDVGGLGGLFGSGQPGA